VSARLDSVRSPLAAIAALLAGLGVVAALLDLDLVPMGVPVAIILGIETVVDVAFAGLPPRRRWSDERRRVAGVIALVWLVFVPLALGLGSVATACACLSDHPPRLLLGLMPMTWVTAGSVPAPILMGLVSIGRPSVAAEQRSS
jgi:hypothetical protein